MNVNRGFCQTVRNGDTLLNVSTWLGWIWGSRSPSVNISQICLRMTTNKQEEDNLKEHPPAEKEEKGWVTTDLTKLRPRHRKATRNQGSRAINSVLSLKTTNPITVVPPFAVEVQDRAAAIIAAPHSHGIPLEEQEVYSLDHIHPQVDHSSKYYPPGDLAFTPIHNFSKFQGLHSPRWRNKELYKTKRPHCTRYGGIHDVTRNADGTSFLDSL